jgi:chromate transport protein ChrA
MRLLVEALFSVNTAFAALSMVFSASLSASLPFIHLEVSLNRLLGIRQTDYIRGYFTIWIPSLLLALGLLMLLRFLNGLHITESLVRSLAGITILLCPTAVWTCGYLRNGWSLQWPYKTIWGEAAIALICVCIFLKGPWEMSRKIGVSALLGHCIFWYWFTSDGFHWPIRFEWGLPGYGGPFGMVVGICTLLVWGLYAYRTREHSVGIA